MDGRAAGVADSAPQARVKQLPALPNVGLLVTRAALTGRRRPSPDDGLPSTRVVLDGLQQDVDRLGRYAHLCGFTLRDTVPATWLHVLSFPLQAHLLAAADFPFAVAGLVHVSNEMSLLRPVKVTELLTVSCSAAHVTPHRHGATFDMINEVQVAGDVVWRGVSTYLARGTFLDAHGTAALGAPGAPASVTPDDGRVDDAPAPASAASTPAGDRLPLGRAPVPAPTARWQLPADLGRRYAGVSGDVNPIHLHPWTARLYGFRRPIVHGMWTHARALAAIENRLPAAYTAAVRFTKPILLPATVGFGAQRGADGWHVAVTTRDGTKNHLLGRFSALS